MSFMLLPIGLNLSIALVINAFRRINWMQIVCVRGRIRGRLSFQCSRSGIVCCCPKWNVRIAMQLVLRVRGHQILSEIRWCGQIYFGFDVRILRWRCQDLRRHCVQLMGRRCLWDNVGLLLSLELGQSGGWGARTLSFWFVVAWAGCAGMTVWYVLT